MHKEDFSLVKKVKVVNDVNKITFYILIMTHFFSPNFTHSRQQPKTNEQIRDNKIIKISARRNRVKSLMWLVNFLAVSSLMKPLILTEPSLHKT